MAMAFSATVNPTYDAVMEAYEAEERIRQFFPHLNRLYSRLAPENLVTYNSRKDISQLRCTYAQNPSQIHVDTSSFVVFIDGGCRANGTPNARAAYGIYFGPNSPRNRAGCLPLSEQRTSSRAEVYALEVAIDIIESVTASDMTLSQIKIVTDSAYLVNAFNDWIHQWIHNDGRDARGNLVAYYNTFRRLHEKMDELTYGDDGGLNFQFWQVPREQNANADRLANAALDREGVAS